MTRRPKYGAVPTTTPDGIRHPSKRQAKRWEELKLLERAGEIVNLKREVPFKLEVNGELICTYRADHVYDWKHGGGSVVEDSKGMRTDVFRLKAKLMKAVLGIHVKEV